MMSLAATVSCIAVYGHSQCCNGCLSCCYLIIPGSVGVAVGKKGKKMTKQTLLKQAEEKQQKLQEAASRQDKV